MRAYVAPDSTPRAFHAENIPYNNEHSLQLSKKGTQPGDTVFVTGFPGSTERLSTFEEINFEFAELTPFYISFYQNLKRILSELGENDQEVKEKTSSILFSIDNVIKNNIETLKTVESIHYLADKEALQNELKEWISSSEVLEEKYSGVIESLHEIHQEENASWRARFYEDLIVRSSLVGLGGTALAIARFAKEREKADEERAIGYQERDVEATLRNLESKHNRYNRKVSQAIMTYYIKSILQLDQEQQPEYLAEIFDLSNLDTLEEQMNVLYNSTQMENLELTKEMLENATWENIQNSEDPFIKMALSALPVIEGAEDRSKKFRGKKVILLGKYMSALREFLATKSMIMAPDANSTLRVTFGKVQAYKNEDGSIKEAYTNLSQLVLEEHVEGDPEFHVPQELIEAYHATHGATEYSMANSQEVPVNFIANVDTTGGNSGSAALNSEGHLIGLLFDGTSETLYGDYQFDQNVRSILVDVRYILWTLENVAKADELLLELGITGASP